MDTDSANEQSPVPASATQIILRLCDDVAEVWGEHISTHYDGCYKRHVACFSRMVEDLIREDQDDTATTGRD